MNPRGIQKNNQGLTLIELMVVISIMMTVNMMIFLSNRTVNVARNVGMSAYRLASEIRKMQSYTLNLQNYTNGKYPAGGWGLYFNKGNAANTFYRTYADGHTNLPDQLYNVDEQFQVVKLPTSVKIKDIRLAKLVGGVVQPAVSVTDLHLTFEPPDPATWICTTDGGTDCSGQYVEIVISDDQGDHEEKVLINKYGLIEVE